MKPLSRIEIMLIAFIAFNVIMIAIKLIEHFG